MPQKVSRERVIYYLDFEHVSVALIISIYRKHSITATLFSYCSNGISVQLYIILQAQALNQLTLFLFFVTIRHMGPWHQIKQ